MACKGCVGKSIPAISKVEKLKKLQGKSVLLPNGKRIEFNSDGKAFRIE